MSTDAIHAVIDGERQLAAAHLTLDLQIIDELLHPDYVIVQPGGEIESKQAVLASYQTGDRVWHSAKVDDLDVRVYGNMAMVVGHWQASGRNGSVQFDYEARFLSVWVNELGRWQNVGYQATEI
ncbi:MAG: nuclear transport factor 2 family protein [Chloroflexota bacterium]